MTVVKVLSLGAGGTDQELIGPLFVWQALAFCGATRATGSVFTRDFAMESLAALLEESGKAALLLGIESLGNEGAENIQKRPTLTEQDLNVELDGGDVFFYRHWLSPLICCHFPNAGQSIAPAELAQPLYIAPPAPQEHRERRQDHRHKDANKNAGQLHGLSPVTSRWSRSASP